MRHNSPFRILFLVTEDWYFCSHRIEVARAAKREGFEVIIVTRVQDHGQKIQEEGFKLIPVNILRRGSSLFRELALIWQLIRIYKREQPDIVHHVALQAVLYGSVAVLLSRVKAKKVNALAGLGYVFTSTQRKAKLLRPFVKLALRTLLAGSNTRVILQNPDDQQFLVGSGILKEEKTVLIRGSGVDTNVFRFILEPQGCPLVIMASRMLWDKGVGEFVEAARHLIAWGVKARFALVGDSDQGNRFAVPNSQLKAWHMEGIVEWWGRREDMPSVFSQTNIVCLPSAYGEGIPKVLIEAAACGRAIVTTNTPGCREIVRDGINGLLVPARNSTALAVAIKTLIASPEIRSRMGAVGRQLVEQEFSQEIVIAQTLHLYQEMLE